MAGEIFGNLVGTEIVHFDDEDLTTIESAMLASIERAKERRVLARDPKPTVSVPKAADVSSSNRANRILTPCRFSGTLTGAVHKVVIFGSVSF